MHIHILERNSHCGFDGVKIKFYDDDINGHICCCQPVLREAEEDRLYSVELHRGSRGFGFSIRGGKEFNNMPLFVLRVADGGAADVDGRLRVRQLSALWVGHMRWALWVGYGNSS